jgi:NADPH:quinone reductase-like Zn-dependent oxidoreductase
MRCITIREPGGVKNLIYSNIPIPEPAAGEVLVKVRAVGINPIDIKTRKGKGLYTALKDEDPLIPGWDISGIIEKCGENAGTFKPGDAVFGMVRFPGHGKAYAEYVTAHESHLTLKPASISFEEGAAASLAALTAWQVLRYKMNLKPGNRILIHSAAGGVGHFAVQMAKHLGAWVAGTASEKNIEFVVNLGADRYINYEKSKFEEELSDLDFVLDTIGGDYSDRSFKVLKPGGTIICIPSGASDGLSEKASALGLNGEFFRVQSNGEHMKEIAGLLESGTLKAHISSRYTFDQIREAHLQIETGKTKGKIVLSL